VFGVGGLGFGVSRVSQVSGFRFQVSGFGLRVSDLRFGVSIFGFESFRSRISASGSRFGV